MVEVIETFKTPDGKLFETRIEAEKHEKTLVPFKVTFSGHSDDTIIVDIDKNIEGWKDEYYSGVEFKIMVRGKAIIVSPNYYGTWVFPFYNDEEDEDILSEIDYEISHSENGYSMDLTLHLPAGSTFHRVD